MKVNNKYLKNNILNNLTKNTNVYPQYITKKPSNSFLKKNISDKYIKKIYLKSTQIKILLFIIMKKILIKEIQLKLIN